MAEVMVDVFFQLGIVFILAAVAAYLLRLLRQPQILAYVLVGILITPVFQFITDTSIIESMSIIGIAFLLFIVGLEMDLRVLKSVALVSTVGGGVKTIILFVIGYLTALLLGFLSLEGVYIGLVLAFSSTMVVLKLLSDRRELATLHGRLAIGLLLVQDIVAIFALSVLTSVNDFSWTLFGWACVKFLALFAVAYIASKFLFPAIFGFAAKRHELLLISSLAVCFLFSLAFSYLGFSIAIGALVAGVALGNLKYNIEIIAKMRSLRDFFSLLFFVSLGMGISLTVLKDAGISLLVLLLLVILVKPFITMFVCSLFRYTKKPSFLASIHLAQIGEFSLLLAAQGLALGHISQNLYSQIVVVTLISITVSSYVIKYDYFLYHLMEKPLKIFEVFSPEGMEFIPKENPPSIILCGHNRIGYSILKQFSHLKDNLLIIDYNPEIITLVSKQGYHCLYGDVTDEEVIERMHLKRITMLISTVPDLDDNLLLIRKVREANKKASIIVTGMDNDDALKLYKHGADYVILPHFLGGEHVANILLQHQKKKLNLRDEKRHHIHHIKERKQVGHEHPPRH